MNTHRLHAAIDRRTRRPHTQPGRVLVCVLAIVAAHAAHARCAEGVAPLNTPAPANQDAGSARQAVLQLLDQASQRSSQIGAARMLTEAALADAEEAKAGSMPQASFTTSLGTIGTQAEGGPMRSYAQLRPGLSVSAPLYDAGRVTALGQWRDSLAEAARQGQLTTQEQIALQTVNIALDRDRYRLHVQVWNQYAQKVCGLVDSLEQIVRLDRGRASELVQARKTLQQVLLSRAQALSRLRQSEIRLKRFVGPDLPDTGSLAALLLDAPPLAVLSQQAINSPAIVQLDAQAEAASHLADATVAGQKPQANWSVGVSKNAVGDKTGNWNATVTVSIPLFNAGYAPAAKSAKLRADAARLQRTDAVESLNSRLAEVHDQAETAITRARDISSALQTSDEVRAATLQQWQQLGRRSLFDVVSAEGDHYNLRIAYVDALHDSQQSIALLWSLAGSVKRPLE